MNYKEISQETIGFLYKSHRSIRTSGIDETLVALAELRVSQLNGCAYCCAFHAEELRRFGMSLQVIDKLPGWKLTNAFNQKQKLVLQWAEAITLLHNDLDTVRTQMLQQFSEKEVVEITASISLMNALNRLRITLGDVD
ncbi:MAG: carboxymuconolactone decarboxylase family protein [Filimonas sp.]|nr:carboxymuconolactone decarboxylase family protein [Filimonas sp.]